MPEIFSEQAQNPFLEIQQLESELHSLKQTQADNHCLELQIQKE